MDLKKYYTLTNKFLDEFEAAQQKILRFHLEDSLPQMRASLESFLAHIKVVKEELGEIDKKSDDFLIKMRIDLLVMHIHIILQVLEKLDIHEKNPFKIIGIFDKQHVFKNVLRSHIEDMKVRLQK
jgi:uncharacterized protein YnzC (UPF0291/DUF896 family)